MRSRKHKWAVKDSQRGFCVFQCVRCSTTIFASVPGPMRRGRHGVLAGVSNWTGKCDANSVARIMES